MTLTESLVALRSRPSPGMVVKAVAAVVHQGRFLEVLYGIMSSFLHRPGAVVRSEAADRVFRRAHLHIQDTEKVVFANWLAGFPRVGRWLHGVPLRLHTVADVGGYTVAAEYGESDPRMFLMDETTCSVSTHYFGMKGLRHLHCVHPLSADRFIITTGDSLRVADLWRIDAGSLHFERRLLGFFGGFTASVTVMGQSYFGSDYSGRPNYLWRLSDGRRFFLPGECFRMFVDEMQVVDDRYLIVICKKLDAAGGGRRPAVFDAKTERFVIWDA